MGVENPIEKAFQEAARETLSTMAMLEMEVGESVPARSISSTLGLTATMGLCGESEGLLVLSLGAPLACRIVASMLGMEEDEVEDDLVDGVGEIANMVAGGAKTALADGPHAFDLSLPAMIRGAKSEVTPMAGTPGLTMNCKVGEETLLMGVWMHGMEL